METSARSTKTPLPIKTPKEASKRSKFNIPLKPCLSGLDKTRGSITPTKARTPRP